MFTQMPVFSDVFSLQLVECEDVEPMHKWFTVFVYIYVFPQTVNVDWGSCLISSILYL
jgi:hypothetical protein